LKPSPCRVLDPKTGEVIRTIPGRAYSASRSRFLRTVMSREGLERAMAGPDVPEVLKTAAEAALAETEAVDLPPG
jgi:hypothetical protein